MTVGLDRLKLTYFRRLNDVHLGTQLTLRSLSAFAESIRSRDGASAYHHFVVPSGGAPVARIRREGRRVAKLIDGLVETDECAKALLLCVGITEDYLHNVLRMVLRAYPERLTQGPRGGPSETPVALDDLIARGRDEIIEERIALRLYRVLHARPADYLTYLSKILRFEPDPATVHAFAEAKATRDIVVHANGRANQVYLEKAGSLARAADGEALTVGQAYFDSCVGVMKRLIGGINDDVSRLYGDDPAVLKAAARFDA